MMRRDPRDIVWAACPRCEQPVEESHLGGHEEFCTGDYWRLREALEEIAEHPGPHADEQAHHKADIAAAALRSRAATREDE